MDRTISAADANRRFSEVLRSVREGESFTVTAHGKPVARIVPAGPQDDERAAAFDSLLARLDAQPAVDGAPWTRDDLYDE